MTLVAGDIADSQAVADAISGSQAVLWAVGATRNAAEAKRREYEVFGVSDLDWTLVRPPRVVAGPPTGRVVIGDRLVSSSVTQGDLAEAMLRLATDRSFIRAAPFVSTPTSE